MQLDVRFADESTPAEPRDAFDVVVAAIDDTASTDSATRAELSWSALHGISVLTRGHDFARKMHGIGSRCSRNCSVGPRSPDQIRPDPWHRDVHGRQAAGRY
ncbi:hypothetical protein QSJ19_22900 [Gordonia sp. ABSL11-1]|uniref:hypothetical protein n=1 Tax=Gordonia sp. ABSL11-1 TaxID=3053924 RepID=UPI002573F5E4|nr:hypothetical protein [Gordonia sp. ABSL11-1]MDL9948374.1 hypothetical protein [Gordonia sp. ABSL11-1]